jgi:hypothetical protein
VHSRPLRVAAVATLALALSAPSCTGASGAADGDSGGGRSSPPTTPPPAPGATFTGHGVSFSYPKGWKEFTLSDSSASTGTVVWTETVGLDGRNIVSVAEYVLDVTITDENLESQTESIGSEIESLFTRAGGELGGGPTTMRLAGLPALSFVGTVRTPNGQAVRTRLVLAFAGTTEYALACQHDDRTRAAIQSGCDQVASTFAVSG